MSVVRSTTLPRLREEHYKYLLFRLLVPHFHFLVSLLWIHNSVSATCFVIRLGRYCFQTHAGTLPAAVDESFTIWKTVVVLRKHPRQEMNRPTVTHAVKQLPFIYQW